MTCGACGDCCDSTSGCFFKTTFNDGSAVSGTKYTGDVTIADAMVGSRVAPQTATGVFGVISYAETHFEPNTEIDGVWGLSVGETCNPACSNNTLDSFFSSDGGDNMKIGLCLAKDEGSPRPVTPLPAILASFPSTCLAERAPVFATPTRAFLAL